MKTSYKILIVLAIIIVIALAGYSFGKNFFKSPVTQNQVAPPKNFDECAAAGFPVQESYPRQCQGYFENIGNELDKSDLIQIETPRPNSAISGTVTILGKARGPWFFEASFPIELQSLDGKVIATSIATAQGEWMTENFVPFSTELEIPKNFSGKANLILKKDNPSGLPEHDDSLIVPLTILLHE